VYLFANGQNVPSHEDWQIVPILSGQRHDWATWLWSQTNEHRIPLPRVIALLVLVPTRYNLCALQYVNVLILSAAALLLMRGAARARGRAVPADALFPLALLNLGNADNFLWSFQIQFISSVVLCCALLVLMARRGPPSPARALAAGVCVVGLALCGANGLVYAAALALWLFAGWALGGPRHGVAPAARLLLLAGAVATAALTGLYFTDYSAPPWAMRPTPGQWAVGVLRFLSNAFGVFPRASGALGAAALGLLLATAGLLLHVYRRRPDARWQCAGLLLFLAASLGLAVCTAWGRAATVGCLHSRYVTLTAPILFCTYFAWDLYGGPRTRPLVTWGLFLAAVALLPWNTQDGLRVAERHRQVGAAFLADVEAGLSPEQLAARYTPQLHFHQDELRKLLIQLREARLGPYARPKAPPYEPPSSAGGAGPSSP
jgi:hypothetical protein